MIECGYFRNFIHNRIECYMMQILNIARLEIEIPFRRITSFKLFERYRKEHSFKIEQSQNLGNVVNKNILSLFNSVCF